jgi:hypothetical protein
VQDNLYQALENAGKENDIIQSAEIFATEISAIMGVRERKYGASQSKWTGKFVNFLIKLYPVAKLSLRLTSALADVSSDLQ